MYTLKNISKVANTIMGAPRFHADFSVVNNAGSTLLCNALTMEELVSQIHDQLAVYKMSRHEFKAEFMSERYCDSRGTTKYVSPFSDREAEIFLTQLTKEPS